MEEHDTTHRYLKQTRYSKSLDHFQFSKTNNCSNSLYNISDILSSTTRQNVQRNNNIQNQNGHTLLDQNFLLSGSSCNCCKNTSIDLNVTAFNGTDKKYKTPAVKNTTSVKNKCQKLVKSLSHTPSESTQHIFRSNSMQVLSPKLTMDTSNLDFMKNGCILEDFKEESKEKEEQATIKRLIEMGEYSSGSSTTETASLIKENKAPLKADGLIVDFVALRKVRSAACLGECVSSVILSGTESLPNITSNENVRYINVVDYSSTSSTCTSERSGWVSSRSSSITSLETNKSNIANGFLRSWSGIEKHLQSLTLDKITSGKRYQTFDRSKGLLLQQKLQNE